jgi:hypothetical protein
MVVHATAALSSRFKRSAISDVNRGAVASLRMCKTASSDLVKAVPAFTTLQSCSPLHLQAVAAGAHEIWFFGNQHVAALFTDESFRSPQHRPALIAQHAYRGRKSVESVTSRSATQKSSGVARVQTPIAGTVASHLTTQRFRFDMDTVFSPDIT